MDVNSVPKECIFCERVFRKRKRLFQYVVSAKTEGKMDRIYQILRIEGRAHKFDKIQGAQYVNYHQTCLSEYEHKLFYTDHPKKTSDNNTSNVWTYRRGIHEKSFARVKQYVQEALIDAKGVRHLAEVYNVYSSMFQEENTERRANLNHTVYAPHHLLKKILHAFPDLTKSTYKNRTYLNRKDLSIEELHKFGFTPQDDFLSKIRSVAFELRRKVMDVEKRYLPKNNISVPNIIEGECDIPTELHTLISCLLFGPRATDNERKEVKVNSICSSIIFSMTNGNVKPSSCLSLGLVAKSLTGSRRIIEILNRLGHCVSYTVVEGLETELAYGGAAETKILPHGLIANSDLRTHVAFDNFDKYVETSTGKDTLHDTVGIVYQNRTRAPVAESVPNGHPINSTADSKRRRRTYISSFDNLVEEYTSKGRPPPPLTGKIQVAPHNLPISTNLNHLWMFSHALGIGETFRWSAWNSRRTMDPNPLQNIGYLPNLNMSPTSDAVVCKTLKTALAIAEECGQKYIIVTYDLAIAIKAFRIKADMSPTFDNIFIALGAFHIQLSFFKVINKSESIIND